jgi:hypothetical protein
LTNKATVDEFAFRESKPDRLREYLEELKTWKPRFEGEP